MNLMDFSKMPKYEKTPLQLSEIIPILKTIMLTKNLGESEMKSLAEAMKPETYAQGDTLIRYGDQGQTYYILAKGTVKVIVYAKGTD